MMGIVRNSTSAPLLRRHQHLFLQGKPLHESMEYVETPLCFRQDFCNSFGWWDSCTMDRTSQDREVFVSFAQCQAAET